MVRIFLVFLTSLIISACGFTFPNQEKLANTIPELNVTGDYHHPFFKKVIKELKIAGVNVNVESSSNTINDDDTIPTLIIPKPNVQDYVSAVDSRAQAIESNFIVNIAATLKIPSHRPILMKNSLTRSALNKTGQSLASTIEKETIIDETYDILARQLVFRIAYLGKLSDPNAHTPAPYELVLSDEEIAAYEKAHSSGNLTLLEALQQKDAEEYSNAKQITLDNLNNGTEILQEPKLPKVKPVLKGTTRISTDNE